MEKEDRNWLCKGLVDAEAFVVQKTGGNLDRLRPLQG